jgi:hypothetical protein
MSTPATPLPADPPLSNRQRHNIRRWARGHHSLTLLQVQELKRLGLIEWVSGNVEGGGYASFPVLSEAGITAVGNVAVKQPTIRNVFVEE